MRWSRSLLLAAVCIAVAACGSESPEGPTGEAMGSQLADEATAREDRGPNRAPVVEGLRISPRQPLPGEQVRARARASDADGDRVELVYQWRIGGERQIEAGPSLHVPSASKGSVIEVMVIARDAHGESAPVRDTVRVGNQAPSLLGVVIEPLGEVTVAHDVVASPRAVDADGDALSYQYQWRVNGNLVADAGPVLQSERYRRGDEIRVAVLASDGQGGRSDRLQSAAFPVVNAAPRITSLPGGFDDSGVFRYRLQVEDLDGDRGFRYRLLEGPAGMALDPVDGALRWQPAEGQAGEHPVKLEVDDRHGGSATQSFVVRVAFEDVSSPAAPAQ